MSAIQFLAIVLVLGNLVSQCQTQIQLSMTTLLQRSMNTEIAAAEWANLLRGLFVNTLLPILTAGGILLLVTTGTHAAITKMGFSLQRLTPKFSRFNPLSKLRELPEQNLKSVIEAILLLTTLGLTIHSFFRNYADRFLRMPFQSVPAATAQIGASLEDMLWKAAAIFVVFGSFDLFRQYRKHMSTLGMTKEEVKEEHKRNEGDPQMKGRIRRLRRDLLKKQMMRDVSKATAVIVNPTHFAVAIRYEPDTTSSPVCVAKGKNWIAKRIRQIAMQHEVPIIENPPLARALYDSLDVGRAIPPEFYKAVAEILAYIYRLMGRKLPD